MKIPVVLSTVHAALDTDGVMAIDLDGRPYASDRRLGREDLHAVLDELTADLGTAVRVEIREADGTKYADIATPTGSVPATAAEPSPIPRPAALAGAGFRPGEEVALAYVVARQPADADGNATLNLPPALLAATRGGLVLLGLTSQTIAPIEAPAETRLQVPA